MDALFWLLVICWIVNRVVVDGLYALQGKPNPRYELQKARLQAAAAAGQAAQVVLPRYGTRDWWADLYSDALAANTRWRRGRARERARKASDGRIDQLVEAVREEPAAAAPAEQPQQQRQEGPTRTVVHDDQHPYCLTPCGPKCTAGGVERPDVDDRPRCRRCPYGRIVGTRSDEHGITDQLCDRCGWLSSHVGHRTTEKASAGDAPSADDSSPIAPVIPLFPTAKEVVMSTNGTDVNGLAAAQAFAQAAAEAHESFATAGSEGYTAALTRFEVGAECLNLAREAQEASQVAAAKWKAHLEALNRQMVVKEAYQSVPDAGSKAFLLNG